jgi:ubiquinone/menaquinone biosynthesis C-methylase UbiE
MALFRAFYDLTYRFSSPVWDDGRIPRPVEELAASVPAEGRALDLGCGTGTQSIYLSQQGFSVVGVDGSQTAIRQAQEKAQKYRTYPEFLVHDVTRLDFLSAPFAIALDIGCLHGLAAAGRSAYARQLTRLTQPGAIFLVWGMDNHFPSFGLTADLLEKEFSPGFSILRTEPSSLHNQRSTWYWLLRR